MPVTPLKHFHRSPLLTGYLSRHDPPAHLISALPTCPISSPHVTHGDLAKSQEEVEIPAISTCQALISGNRLQLQDGGGEGGAVPISKQVFLIQTNALYAQEAGFTQKGVYFSIPHKGFILASNTGS